jgi:hypothetical protein
MKNVRKLVAAALAASASTLPAQAAIYDFTITGDYSARFQLDSSPRPDEAVPGNGFVLWDVEGTFPGSIFDVADLTFFNGGLGGGLEIYDFYGANALLSTDGPQLYSGSENAPTFLTGTYALTQFNGSGTYSLTISNPAVAAVPEPATWAMMFAGFGMVGFAMRRRSKFKTTVSYA